MGKVVVHNLPLTEALKSLVISVQEYTTSGGRAILNSKTPKELIEQKIPTK